MILTRQLNLAFIAVTSNGRRVRIVLHPPQCVIA